MAKTKIYTREQLQEMTVDTLRPLALYDLGIHGVSKARKDDIIDAILSSQNQKLYENDLGGEADWDELETFEGTK